MRGNCNEEIRSDKEFNNMALIECPECGKEFSDKAQACPNCGCPTDEVLEIVIWKQL